MYQCKPSKKPVQIISAITAIKINTNNLKALNILNYCLSKYFLYTFILCVKQFYNIDEAY